MKKNLVIAIALFAGGALLAGSPPNGGRGCHDTRGYRPCSPRRPPCPPPRPLYRHHRPGGYWDRGRGSSGVRLASDIVDLVGTSIGVVNALSTPAVVVVPAQPAVVQQPIVQSVPVVQQVPVTVQPYEQQAPVQSTQQPIVQKTIIVVQPQSTEPTQTSPGVIEREKWW